MTVHPSDDGDELVETPETGPENDRAEGETSTDGSAQDEETIVPLKDSNDPSETVTFRFSSKDEIGESSKSFGRYRLLRPLGKGGMGTVYLARDTMLDRDVALKMPDLGGAANAEILERFYREARAAANLRHNNLCPVFDVGEIDGQHFLTMPFVNGNPLSSYIKPNKPIPTRQVVRLVRKLALAMQIAHEHEVIHRDLKPANVVVSEKGEPVIVDFGLARRVGSDAKLTETGVGLGTPSYMSPEQVQGDLSQIGPECDVYSLGVILYELLVGKPPFQGNLFAIISQILESNPQAPSVLRKDISPELDRICLKAIAKSREDRFRSMQELANALQGLLVPGAKAQGGADGLAPIESVDPLDTPTDVLDLAEDDIRAALESTPRQLAPTTSTPTPTVASPYAGVPTVGHSTQQSAPTQVSDLLLDVGKLEFYRRPATKRWFASMSLLSVAGIRLLSLINIVIFILMESPGALGWTCTSISLFVSVLSWTIAGFATRYLVVQDAMSMRVLKWLAVACLVSIAIESIAVIVTFGVSADEAMSASALYSDSTGYSESLEDLVDDPEMKQALSQDPFEGQAYRSRIQRLIGWLFVRIIECALLGFALRLVVVRKAKLDDRPSPSNESGTNQHA